MDRIYYNGSIITVKYASGEEELASSPEALLVRDGKIVSTGTYEAVSAQAGAAFEKVDLDGRCLMPAFVDPHGHIVMNGQMSFCASLGDCESYQDIVDTLKKYLEEHQIGPDGVVFGFGYDHNFLKEGGQPDRRVLDRVSTDVPIFIMHVSAHLACANSKALELAGITADTPDPDGGVIGRLPGSREPSGYFEEAGMLAAQSAVAPRMRAGFDFTKMVSGMQQSYIEHGITTAQDGASAAADISTLKDAVQAGMLKIDVVAYPLMPKGGVDLLHENEEIVGKYKNHLKIGGYKLVLDGSPQGRSAWMTKPYLGGDPAYCGYPWMPDDEVQKYVKTAVSEGRQLLAHCNGDAAGDQFLDAYEKALWETGSKADLRPVMIHCQTARNDQLDRMAKIDMIASIFVGHVFYWGDVHMKNFGPERGHHISPVRDALGRGLTVNFHQDTPVTAPDMLHSVWCAVNRLSRTGKLIGGNQKVSVYDALKAVTIGGAYEYFEENEKGTLEKGKRADMVILDRSPLDVEPMEIRDIKVLETIKDGETIYRK